MSHHATRSRAGAMDVSRAGFTLVELLVVIGIIVLLIAILMPALGRVQAQARMVQCQSNLRQIGQGISMYTVANKGFLPIGFWNGKATGQPDASGTHWVLLVQNAFSGQYGADWDSSYSTGASLSGLRKVFICPDAPGDYSTDRSISGVTSYLSHPRLMPYMNLTGGWPQDSFGGTAKPFRPYRLSKVRRSAEVALVFDGSLEPRPSDPNIWAPAGEVPVAFCLDAYGVMNGPPNSTYMTDAYPATGGASWNNPGAAINFSPMQGGRLNSDGPGNQNQIRFRHQKQTTVNCLMVDGHVQTFNYRDSTNGGMKRGNINVNPPN